MTETSKCIFCGSPLDEDHQFICQPCIDRYKQDHSQDFAEARLHTVMHEIKSNSCLLCGQTLDSPSPWTPLPEKRIPLCDYCKELLFGTEDAGNV